jgi:molybdenum cofactor synthesis domain-containing protein
MPTAAAVIIGNEILTGKFPDENGPWLIERSREIGLDLKRMTVIEDTVEAIAEEVAISAKRVDWVLTTGGIGPTHDDVTMQGIAAAFGLQIERNETLRGMIETYMGNKVNDAALQMADVPQGSILWQENVKHFPVVVCRNVVIFPGVPAYFQAKFNAIAHRFEGQPIQSLKLITHQTEPAIAQVLAMADTRWADVAIGSYPRFDTSPRSVIITLDSRSMQSLRDAHDWIASELNTLTSESPPSHET